MPRVIGVDIPNNKRLEISLTYVFGVVRVVCSNPRHKQRQGR